MLMRAARDNWPTIARYAIVQDRPLGENRSRALPSRARASHHSSWLRWRKHPYTIVATAASSEKTSFGCQPENEWTYFGDALFNQSMSRGRGLMQAFAEAKAYVSMWEQRDRLTPSEPQLSVGAEAGAFLVQIEK
jgi:hypothetical protein